MSEQSMADYEEYFHGGPEPMKLPPAEKHGIMMKSDDDWKVIEAMRKFGGSWVTSLGECFLRADATNYAKLRKTFAEEWKQYRKLAVEGK